MGYMSKPPGSKIDEVNMDDHLESWGSSSHKVISFEVHRNSLYAVVESSSEYIVVIASNIFEFKIEDLITQETYHSWPGC